MKKRTPGLLLLLPALILFTGLAVPPAHTEYDWMVEGNNENSDFGFWLDGGGDVNGDGYADVIVGAPEYTHAFAGEGAAFIYYGGPDGLSTEANWVRYGEMDSSGFGRCVSINGDVNGDGYSDVLIGSHQYAGASPNEGKVYFYAGGPDGPDTVASWTMLSNRKGAKLGEAVSIVGDLNRDGYDDICVGAHGWDDNETLGDLGNKAGKAWVFLGTPDGPSNDVNFTEIGAVTDANIGVSVDRAGDINGDGYMDLIIGGYIFLIGDGMICVFRGDNTGVDEDLEFMAVGGAMDTSFYAINQSTAGDLNGDGYDDIVIGAPRYDANGIYQSGKCHVHYGSAEGMQAEIGWIGTGSQYDERWAFNVNEGGDINHDGYGDLLIGAKYYDNGPMTNAGKAELYLGGPEGPQRKPVWTFMGLDSTDDVGTNLCNAGDVNGDGYDDIVVSGDEYSNDLSREGVVYAFYGQPQQCNPPQHPGVMFLTPNSATISWSWLYGAQKYKFYMKRIDGPAPQYMIPTQDSVLIIGGLIPGAHYKGYVQAKCDGGWTDRSIYIDFTTPLHKEGEMSNVSVFPTLASSQISVDLGTTTGPAVINIIDMRGELVYTQKYTINEVNTVVVVNAVRELPSGNYIVSIESNTGRTTRQFVKQ